MNATKSQGPEPIQPVIAGQLSEIKKQQREMGEICANLKSLASRVGAFHEDAGKKQDSENPPQDFSVKNELSEIGTFNFGLIARLNEIYEHLSGLV